MNFADRIRTVRTTRLGDTATQPREAAAQQPTSQRHPAMQGINVSPVHGRHCICDRCTPAARVDAS